jgi:hypothetical protein
MASEAKIAGPLGSETKQIMAAVLWDGVPHEVDTRLAAYFRYYAKQCEVVALHDGGKHVCVQTHQAIGRIVAMIRKDKTWREVHDSLRGDNSSASDEERSNTINLAARALMMMEIGNISFAHSGSRGLEWSQGSLRDFIHQRFPSKHTLHHEKTKLEKIFNARGISRIAGMQILWTNNLADHLRLMNDDKGVAIFHHASFLQRQQRYSSNYLPTHTGILWRI